MKKIESDIIQFIEECMETEHPESYLIAVLHKIQGRYGYLCEDHMSQVAQLMQIPTSTISAWRLSITFLG